MPQAKKLKSDDQAQSKRFIKKAKEVSNEKSGEAFNKALKKIFSREKVLRNRDENH